MTKPETTDQAMAKLFERWQRNLETAIYHVYIKVIPYDFDTLCTLMHREMGLSGGAGADVVDGRYVKVYGKFYEDKYRIMFKVEQDTPIYMFFTEDDIRAVYNRFVK
ncbi:hypothetical protein CPT_Moabite_209 [Serratia phage Moabite]|uniref:Uncharacterized protein n=3 Tax=Moabitevirus TaxID=2843422 RepID=A0A7T3NC21_9CAUD|nr:hypothetical protein HWB23_gp135 [Serratia phage vB_SmaM_ 2050HW]YP_009849303.1 hypothetical protein HWC48_gp207 [Serratia phage Moabite]QPX76942.1 hypothetical protein [Serratia phage vB_SmaM_Yaphecito]UCR74736.1 hypothetical protein [Serratia phage BUCT660]UGO54094.1 hypothetical protein HAYMO_112 [Serratia phage vB_SmaM_Haymo]UQT03603.1 hypothetical protein KODAMA_01360 [Serratia phage vB_SmaM-Kodama]ATA65470.1 hypothetical protein 2050HW_00135 [Serratia phage vB_SmaM_ 2050HW]